MLNRRMLFRTSGAVLGMSASQASTHGVESQGRSWKVDGYGYRLPKFKSGSRLLFQGDSITDMKWGRNEQDRNHYLGHSYVYLIAARLGADMPESPLDIYNRGVSGHKVGDLRARWQTDAIDMRPDLLSILVGVNDVGRNLDGVDIQAWESDYRYLLDASRQANPDLRIVLLDPFVVPSGRLASMKAYQQWRDQIERLIPVVEKLAKTYDAVNIKTQQVFDAAAQEVSPEHWVWDGVHPLPQGHEIIARHWLQAVSERWY